MADDGKSIADAYRNWSPDNATAAPSAGASIADAYRAQAAATPPPAAPTQDPYSGAPTSINYQPDYAALGRIGQAAAGGWEGVHAIPRVPTNLVMAPVYNPLLAGVETAFRAGGALLRGGQQAVVEATPDIHLGSVPTIPLGGGRFISGELTPGSLGREVAALPEAFPTGFNALRAPGRPPIPEAPPPGPRFVSELTAPPRPPGMTDAARINQLIEHAVNEEQPAVGPPMARGPATQEPANALGDLGAPAAAPAAVPPQPIPNNLTPAQVAEFRNIPEDLPPAAKPIATQADAAARADQIINHFASIGNKEPIPGAEGALPTITGNSGLATLYRAVRDSDTPVPFTTLENASKAKAMSTLEDMGATTSQASQDRLAAAIENRAQTTAPMYKQAFDNKTSADTTGSTQMVEDLLKSKAKQNDNLRPELEAIQKKLAGETDPEQLKGIVDNIDTTMDRLGTEGKGDRETRRVMSAVKDQLISEIGPAAPGFDAAQATYSQLSRDVDRMKYFQGRKLTDLQGNPTLGNMRSMLDDIRKKQAGDKFHPADSVTPEDVKTIQGIHDQMQREQFTATAGKALGSNTFQNLATNAQVGRLGGHMSNALLGAGAAGIDMLHGGSGLGGAIVGNVLAEGGKYVRGRMAATAEATAERGRAMLMQELRDRLLNIDNKGVDALRGAPPP